MAHLDLRNEQVHDSSFSWRKETLRSEENEEKGEQMSLWQHVATVLLGGEETNKSCEVTCSKHRLAASSIVLVASRDIHFKAFHDPPVLSFRRSVPPGSRSAWPVQEPISKGQRPQRQRPASRLRECGSGPGCFDFDPLTVHSCSVQGATEKYELFF